MKVIRDPVDELLKADAAEHRHQYIEDDGFALRVMDTLPARRGVSARQRVAIPMGFAGFAALIVVCFTSGGNFFVDAMMDIATASATPSSFAYLTLMLVFVATSFAVARDS